MKRNSNWINRKLVLIWF